MENLVLMESEVRDEIKLEKKIEAILGIFFLIPPVLGVLSFVLCLLGGNGDFARMRNLSYQWVADWGNNGGGGMSAAPVYLGLMAIVGAYLLKGNLRFLFKKKPSEGNTSEQ